MTEHLTDDLLIALALQEIDPPEQERLSTHLADCATCRAEYHALEDAVGRTLTARIRLANKSDMLRIGLFGTARVVAKGEKTGDPVLVVPRSALIDVAGKTVVFVRVGPPGHDEEFELHEVTTGEAAAGNVRVLSGLREGEEIVVEGAFTIKSVILRGTLADED